MSKIHVRNWPKISQNHLDSWIRAESPIRFQVLYSKINTSSSKATPKLRKVYTHILEIKLNMSTLKQTRENLKKREARNACYSVGETSFRLLSKYRHLCLPLLPLLPISPMEFESERESMLSYEFYSKYSQIHRSFKDKTAS